MKTTKSRKRTWLPAWLVTVILMLLSPVVAHAYEYVELEGGEYTSSYLASVCSGKHVFFNGDATLIINENLSIKEIYSWGKVTIISNGHRFDIEQDDASRNAMTIWGGVEIRGSGSVIVQAHKHALVLNSGQLLVWNGSARFQSYAESAIHSNSENVNIAISNGAATFESPTAAVDGEVKKFSISGDNSYVYVRGPLKGIGEFQISGGYFNLINTTSGPYTIHAQSIDFTGGKIYVTESHPDDELCDATEFYSSIKCNNSVNISNCSLEVYAYPYIAITGFHINITNAKVKARGRYYALYSNGQYGRATLDGELNEVVLNAANAIEAIYLDLKGGKLVARGGQFPIRIPIINISPHAGCSFESYAYKGSNYMPSSFEDSGFPFLAQVDTYSYNHIINLQRPTAITGSIPGQEGLFSGRLLKRKDPWAIINADIYYFGLSDGSPFNYVRLGVPHIQNMTGVNNPFLLQPSGMTSTKHVTPGDTLLLNLAPLEPYSHFPDADGRPVVKLVKRNPNTGTSSYIVEEQADTTNGNWNWSYTFTEQDVNCYYTVEVELDGYEGSLQSRQYYVSKLENWNHPVKPVLSFLSGGIRVSNARTNQEYILLSEAQFNQFLNTPNEASWWQNSYKPTGSTLSITNCYLGQINYVVTRCKETISTLPGYEHAHASILLDNSITVTSGLKLDVTAVGSGNFADMEYYNGHVTYTTLKSGVLKVTINPLPSNATDFEGIRGQDFNIGYYGAPYNTNMCALYANSACTTPLNANTRYKTVYVKPLLSGSDLPVVNISLYPDNGGPDDLIATTPLYLNVSDDNGNFTPYTLLVNNGEIVEAHKWENVEGIPFAVFPQRASLTGDVTVTYSNVQGPFPNIAGQTNRRPSFTVDKEKRTINMIASTQSYMLENHTYYFTVAHKINGATYGWGSLKVNIVKRELTGLTLDHTEATVDPGGTEEFSVISTPDEVWQEDYVNKTFTSSDESVATVRWDGGGRHVVIVTVPEDAPIGATATITVGALDTDVTATATITVGGEAYNLWVDNNQVTSFNAGDVLGDSTVFYQGTSQNGSLKLCGSTIANGIRSEIPSLVVDVRTPTVTVSGGSRFDGKNTYFTGNGFYKTTFSGSGNTSFIAKNVTVTDSVLLRTWSSFKAFEADNLTVEGDSAEVQAYSYNNASMVIHESLNGTITRPEGAVWNPETGWIAVGPDNLDTYVTNAYVFIKGLHGESFPLGDVNCDGSVNAADVTALYSFILNGNTTYEATSDVNGDNFINAADVTAVYKIILGN
jgi:hypothetical protein